MWFLQEFSVKYQKPLLIWNAHFSAFSMIETRTFLARNTHYRAFRVVMSGIALNCSDDFRVEKSCIEFDQSDCQFPIGLSIAIGVTLLDWIFMMLLIIFCWTDDNQNCCPNCWSQHSEQTTWHTQSKRPTERDFGNVMSSFQVCGNNVARMTVQNLGSLCKGLTTEAG